MTKVTIATLFSGGEGVGVGALQAGIKHLWGIEYDPDIAAVAQTNGFSATVADVTQCDPEDYERPDILHASPPCPNFSTAKTNRGETEGDTAMSAAVCRFIRVLRPDAFTLENVYGYRKSESFKTILVTLHRQGYEFRWWHLNSADYGVPQTRKRLVLVASLDRVPQRPQATHQNPAQIIEGQLGLFGEQLPPWVGWYEAIEDLLPTLPESQFAPWQLARLPEELKTMLLGAGGYAGAIVRSDKDSPSFVVTANTNQATQLRAFIVAPNSNPASFGSNMRDEADPNFTITNNANGRMRAYLVGGQYGQPAGTPGRTVQCTDGPAFVVTAVNKGDWTGAALGRVVQMTPPALARFQSFPDWYQLSGNKTLDCRIIGNAVPPLLYKCVIEASMRRRL